MRNRSGLPPRGRDCRVGSAASDLIRSIISSDFPSRGRSIIESSCSATGETIGSRSSRPSSRRRTRSSPGKLRASPSWKSDWLRSRSGSIVTRATRTSRRRATRPRSGGAGKTRRRRSVSSASAADSRDTLARIAIWCLRTRSASSSICFPPSAKTAGARCPRWRTRQRLGTSKPRCRLSCRTRRSGVVTGSRARVAATRRVRRTTPT